MYNFSGARSSLHGRQVSTPLLQGDVIRCLMQLERASLGSGKQHDVKRVSRSRRHIAIDGLEASGMHSPLLWHTSWKCILHGLFFKIDDEVGNCNSFLSIPHSFNTGAPAQELDRSEPKLGLTAKA